MEMRPPRVTSAPQAISRRAFVAGLCGLAAASSGCGYVMAGEWDDDPGNWRRAFGVTQPHHVSVIHSKYWRSPHWTLEFSYFFEFAPNDRLRDELVSSSRLRAIDGTAAAHAKAELFAPPKWFAPKAESRYEVLSVDGRTERNLRMFVDRDLRSIFLTDFQA